MAVDELRRGGLCAPSGYLRAFDLREFARETGFGLAVLCGAAAPLCSERVALSCTLVLCGLPLWPPGAAGPRMTLATM